MTFHEIWKYTILDEKICNYKIYVSIFIKSIQNMISIVEGAYVCKSVFRCTAGFASQWLLKCVAKCIHTDVY